MLYNTPELRWITLFFVYSFLGWVFESCYVSLKAGKWINRGFMKGPYLPIYGTGAVMMLVVSEPFKNNLVLMFIAGVVGATLLELVTGMAIEHIFKVRYWDYSYQKFNYKGYICLSSSIAWGFFTIALNKWLHPAVSRVLKLIPDTTGEILFAGVFIIFSVDLVLSVREALDMRNILVRMEAIRSEVQEIKKRADKWAGDRLVALDESLRGMKEGIEMHNAEIGRAIVESQAEFGRAIVESQAEFGRAIGESQAEFGRAIGGPHTDFSKLYEEQQAGFARRLGELDEARRRAESDIFHLRKRIQRNPGMASKKYGLSFDILKGSIVIDKGNGDKEDVDERVS